MVGISRADRDVHFSTIAEDYGSRTFNIEQYAGSSASSELLKILANHIPRSSQVIHGSLSRRRGMLSWWLRHIFEWHFSLSICLLETCRYSEFKLPASIHEAWPGTHSTSLVNGEEMRWCQILTDCMSIFCCS